MPLSLDTELPTPYGWTRVNDLNSGSVLFDELGYPARVVNLSPPYMADGYELWAGWGKRKFPEDDGRLLVGGDQRFMAINHRKMEHFTEFKTLQGITAPPSNWPTWVKSNHGNVKPLATEIVAEELVGNVRKVRKHGSLRTDTYLNWHIPITFPLQLPTRKSAVDAYVLGCCINYYRDGKFKVNLRSYEWYKSQFEDAGYQLTYESTSNNRSPHRVFKCDVGQELKWKLSQMGFCNQIPRDYLRSPEPDRRALLGGLMDMWRPPLFDGTTTRGQPTLYATRDPELHSSVVELVRSLGYPCWTDEIDYGNEAKPQWKTIEWHPVDPPNLYPKLRLRYMHNTYRVGNDLERFVWKIYSVEEHGRIPVRDISVEGNYNMFSAGRLLLPVKGDPRG